MIDELVKTIFSRKAAKDAKFFSYKHVIFAALRDILSFYDTVNG